MADVGDVGTPDLSRSYYNLTSQKTDLNLMLWLGTVIVEARRHARRSHLAHPSLDSPVVEHAHYFFQIDRHLTTTIFY